MPTLRRYGWRRDLPDARDVPFAVPASVLSALPPRVDLRADGFAAVLDQRDAGAASVYAVAAVYGWASGGDDVVPALLPLHDGDGGGSLRDVLKRLRARGVAVEYWRVPQSLVHLKGCLAAGRPFVFGFSVYESFEREDVRETGKVPVPAGRERLLAGHAAVALGYDDDDQRFVVRNSWGVEWGDRGDCYLPYAYITNGGLAADFWMLRAAEE